MTPCIIVKYAFLVKQWCFSLKQRELYHSELNEQITSLIGWFPHGAQLQVVENSLFYIWTKSRTCVFKRTTEKCQWAEWAIWASCSAQVMSSMWLSFSVYRVLYSLPLCQISCSCFKMPRRIVNMSKVSNISKLLSSEEEFSVHPGLIL